MSYRLSVCGLSDIGLVRENNEDVWAELPGRQLFVLADGMGGHKAGEVAAAQAVASFCERMEQHFSEEPLDLQRARKAVEEAIVHINYVIHKMGMEDYELRGMGTTFCCLYFHKEGVIYGHVGDSRIYRVREGELEQLTKDHSLVRELVDMGQLDEEQAKEFVYKNIITQAVGTEPLVEPAVLTQSVKEGDLYMMCSDGLTDHVSDKEIENLLKSEVSVMKKAENLVHAAKEKGGHDNITVVLLNCYHEENLSRQ